MKASVAIVTILIFGFGILAILEHGKDLHTAIPAAAKAVSHPDKIRTTQVAEADAPTSLFSTLQQNLRDPLSRLFIQLVLVMLATRLMGALFSRFGQPAVIGEMVAGILLGPSLFGWLCPDAFRFVFQDASLGTLKLFSQIGVCLFMFVVGMELDVKHLRHQARTAVVVSYISIFFPFFLGVTSALFLFQTMATPGSAFVPFALFMGISMSITAFPVLARILDERQLTKTPLGVTAITCAAVGDVAAWIILAAVVSIAKSGGLAACAMNIGFVALFVGVMLLLVKPVLPRWFGQASLNTPRGAKGTMASALLLLFGSALITEVMGIHALFGAFLAGVVIPKGGDFVNTLKVRLEHFSSVFLLPLFFAFTGLRTQIGTLDSTTNWLICGGIILIATTGKLGGTLVSARSSGLNWRDSFSLGALMNTRGLVELIALNIGYDLGILSPQIFAILVVMALVTTFMTGPLLAMAKY